MNHWGVSPCCTNPPVAKAHHRNDANTPRNTTESYPHPPSLPTRWGDNCGPDDRDCHTHTHTDSQDHCAQDGRDTIDIWLCTRTRHRDGVDMPDAGLHPHREAMHKQHTQSGSSCCAPFGDPHVHKERDRMKPGRNAATAAQTHWSQSTIWRGHTRSTTSPKKGKRRGYISKEFCAKTDLCPLASPRVALVGVCLLRHPDNGNTR